LWGNDMSFSYSGALSQDRDKMRFSLHDVASGAGPLPAGANFTDEELAGLLAIEGTWQRAVAAGLEALAAAWAMAGERVGLRDYSVDTSQKALEYRQQAMVWRARYGAAGAGLGNSGMAKLQRTDAWSCSGSEYT
jgi:hypothetical protein